MSGPQYPICLVITVVGRIDGPDTSDMSDLHGFLADVKIALDTRFPRFKPASPPVIVTWSELRDEYIGDSSAK